METPKILIFYNMRQLLFLIPLLAMHVYSIAQNQVHDFGSCFNKQNRKSINMKMENFLTRVSKETNCPKDKLIYTVDEFYTVFYTKKCRHLPKKITFDVCGKKRTYVHTGLSGNITYWLLGSWSLVNNKND